MVAPGGWRSFCNFAASLATRAHCSETLTSIELRNVPRWVWKPRLSALRLEELVDRNQRKRARRKRRGKMRFRKWWLEYLAVLFPEVDGLL